MIKIKFLSYSTLLPWDELCSSLTALRYSDEKQRGINVTLINAELLKATFYEQLSYVETVQHPINGPTEVTATTYIASDFIIHRRRKIFYILNSAKRLNVLLTFLALQLNSFFVSEININIPLFLQFCESTFSNFKVKKLSFPSFSISKTACVSFAISSHEDVFKDLNSIVLPFPPLPSKLYFEGILHNTKMTGSITPSGTCSISDSYGEFFIEKFLSNGELFISAN